MSDLDSALTGLKDARQGGEHGELIARLEAAVGLARALDADIYRAIHGKSPQYCSTHCNGKWVCHDDDDAAPWYTYSVESAMMIVPEEWRVEHVGEQLSGGRWDVELHWREYSQEDCVQSVGRTPAIAICAAALKARQLANTSAA